MSDVRAVEAVNVSKRYEELVALNGISLDVAQGATAPNVEGLHEHTSS